MDDPIRLLIVDDDAIDRLAVKRGLRANGLRFDLVEVENGADVLTTLRQASFDCVLLDYLLPDADGLGVLRAIRTAGDRTPVVVLTGQGDELLAVELMKNGASDYLVKSKFAPDSLVRAIHNAMRLANAEQVAAAAEKQRQTAEMALKRSEHLFNITLCSIGDAVVATDREAHITFMNQAAEQLSGWDGNALGQSLSRVLPLVDGRSGKELPGLATTVLRTGHLIDIDARDQVALCISAHERRAIAGSYAPIRDEEDAIVGVVAVLRDITEQVRATERLRFLAEMSKLLVDSLDYENNLRRLACLIALDLADWCAIDLVKEGALQCFSVALHGQLEEFGAAGWNAPFPIEPAAHHGSSAVISSGEAEFCPAIDDEILAGLNAVQRAKMNKAAIVQFVCVPLIARSRILGAITLGRQAGSPIYDSRDLLFAEEVARHTAIAIDNALLYRDTQEAVHTRDAFLSIATHELKTPLTSLHGYATLLQRRACNEEVLRPRDLHALSVITSQAQRLNLLISSLLDISRVQTGQLTIQRLHFDLAALTRRVAEEIQPAFVDYALALDLPAHEVIVVGDEMRIEQVIQNLIQNALKYSPSGSTIELRLVRTANQAEFTVQDHGLGIPTDAIPHIFARFYRAKNVEARRVSGLGVGLYVVKQIVDLHGGQIEVASVEGQGSSFTVILPLGDDG